MNFKNGLLTVCLGLVFGCGKEKPLVQSKVPLVETKKEEPKIVLPKVETKKEEPKIVLPKHNGRLGLEGEIRCYTLMSSGREFELPMDRTVDLSKSDITYKERQIEPDTVHRCKSANPGEKIVHNFKYGLNFYDVRIWSVLGESKRDIYPVNGFNFSADTNGSVDFLVGSLDPGRYRLEFLVFGLKRDRSGNFVDTPLGTRVVDFIFTKSEAAESEVAEYSLVGKKKTDAGVANDGLDQNLNPFGFRVLEAGR